MTPATDRRGFIISLAALAGLLATPLSAQAQGLRRHLAIGPSGLAGTSPGPGQAATTGKGGALPSRKEAEAATQGLTEGQLATTAALAATIVPADTTPSARDLGAQLYVAAGLALVPPSDFAAVQAGLDAVADQALQTFGLAIGQLPPAALEALGAGISTHPQLGVLWHAVRTLTVLYYYGHPQGFADLGLPGPSLDRGGFPQPNDLPCLG